MKVYADPKKYRKPWFIPILKSKHMTIELLSLLYENRFQVVLLLRSLCKGSEYFLEMFYDVDIKKHFQVYNIEITLPLNLGYASSNDVSIMEERV